MNSAAPHFSILLAPTTPWSDDGVARTLTSLQAQAMREWELLLVSDAATWADAVTRQLDADSRFRSLIVDAAADSGARQNAALSVALGEFVLRLDAGDVLTVDALQRLRSAARAVSADFVYADEDVPSGTAGERVRLAKPDWSPERLSHGDYPGLRALRTAAVRAAGGYASAAAPAMDYDLTLRVTELGGAVAHVRAVLGHRSRLEPPSAQVDEAAGLAAQRHLDRRGVPAAVEPGPLPGSHLLRRTLRSDVRVSLVMPTAWQSATVWGKLRCFVLDAVRSLLGTAGHDDIEVVVVYDEPVPPGALAELDAIGGDRVRLVPYRRDFNFSEKCNVGFLHASGDVIVLINDDVEPMDDRWLTELVAPLDEADVGITGAKLMYGDGTIQHGGHVHTTAPKRPSWPRLAYRHAPGDTPGELNSLFVNRETSGVTAACLAIRREVYERVGGLNEALPGNYNDVDLGLKVQRLGLRILWIATSQLYHFESQSRVSTVTQAERDFIYRRWGGFDGEAYLPWLT